MAIRILHCVSDDKFIDGIVDLMESIPNIVQEYVYIGKDNSLKRFTYIKSPKVKVISAEEFIAKCIDSASYDILYLHSLRTVDVKLIYRIHPDIKVVWSSWGFDIYDFSFPYRKLVKLTNTNRNRLPLKQILKKYKGLFNCFCSELLISHLENRKSFNKSIRRIDYFAGVLPIEYDLVKNDKYFRAKQTFYRYVGKRKKVEKEVAVKYSHEFRTVQIGNSGNPILNHRYVFDLLINRNIDLSKVIVPLSYGGSDEYRAWVAVRGRECFGSNFVALTDFMPYQDYIALVSSVSSLIICSERQIAMGNVFNALRNGVKVFLPESSVTYRYLTTNGARIFGLNDITQKNIDNPLSDEDNNANKKFLSEIWGDYEYSRTRIIRAIEDIVKDK